jgi:hypothetical protein
MKTKLLSILSILLLFLSSCNKDLPTQPKENELTTIQIKTEGILINNLKSFDKDTWVYNYNVNGYYLTFTNENKTYTFLKTIQELKNGFSIQIVPATYTITYQSIKETAISTTSDITINQQKTITNTDTELILNASNSDFLFIVDMININQVQLFSYPDNSYYDLFAFNDIYYAYVSKEGNYRFCYRNITNNNFTFEMTNLKKNNIYHLIKNITGNSYLTILPFDYNVVAI